MSIEANDEIDFSDIETLLADRGRDQAVELASCEAPNDLFLLLLVHPFHALGVGLADEGVGANELALRM